MAKRGRPRKVYNASFHPMIAKFCAMLGYIDSKTAKELNISVTTMKTWKKKYPEFNEALKTGKLHSDEMIEDSLFKRAMGYEYEETEKSEEPLKIEEPIVVPPVQEEEIEIEVVEEPVVKKPVQIEDPEKRKKLKTAWESEWMVTSKDLGDLLSSTIEQKVKSRKKFFKFRVKRRKYL